MAHAETWRFALIGDVPYSDYERAQLPKMLENIADSQAELVAHIGDFKHGKERCDDAIFEDRLQLFNASRIPFIFVPGDNEWTDCSRKSNGAYEPLERLSRLRSLFWPNDQSLGRKKLALVRQSEHTPEHARFRLGPVLFVSLNIPGGNNNWSKTDNPSPEYLARNPLVLGWLKEGFAIAPQKACLASCSSSRPIRALLILLWVCHFPATGNFWRYCAMKPSNILAKSLPYTVTATLAVSTNRYATNEGIKSPISRA